MLTPPPPPRISGKSGVISIDRRRPPLVYYIAYIMNEMRAM